MPYLKLHSLMSFFRPEIAYVQDSVSLPALRQTMGNKAIERRKRTQVLQQDKLKHSVLP